MPPKSRSHLIVKPSGYRSDESGLFLAQFDELSRNLWADLAGATAAELAWQPRRGANTIGMLLAHMAIVEVFWIQRTGKGYDAARMQRTLGIGLDDDGMPMPANALPPATLRGWKLDDFRALHRRARSFAKRAARAFRPADLDRVIPVTLRDGRHMEFNLRWILHHVLEHFAGHHGQVLLLRHLYRDRRKKA